MSKEISKRILDALHRLEKGKPRHPELIERVKRGKPKNLVVNTTTVSMEAGTSRTLIGYDGCEYQAERKVVKKSEGVSERALSNSERVKALAIDARSLRKDLAIRDTVIASMIIDIDRLKSRLGDDDKVVPFRRPDHRKSAG